MTGATSLTVNFVSAAAGAGQLSVDVDDAATVPDSPYSPGSQVVLRLIGRQNAAIATTTLGCSVALTAQGQVFSHTETLSIIKSASLNLSYPAKSVPAIKWLSIIGPAGPVYLDQPDTATVQFSREIVMGICEVTYDVSYDKYTVTGLSGKKALLLFDADDGRDCSLELEILQPAEPVQNVTMLVQDYSTAAPVPGANVTISGPFGFSRTATADGAGVIALGDLTPGEYTVTATAMDYQATGADILANDRFTI